MGEETFRAEIVGASHPHRGARGICDPNNSVQPGAEVLLEVVFDVTENRGADGCFAAAHELKRLAGAKDQ